MLQYLLYSIHLKIYGTISLRKRGRCESSHSSPVVSLMKWVSLATSVKTLGNLAFPQLNPHEVTPMSWNRLRSGLRHITGPPESPCDSQSNVFVSKYYNYSMAGFLGGTTWNLQEGDVHRVKVSSREYLCLPGRFLSDRVRSLQRRTCGL